MIGRIVIFALIVGLVYLNYTTPKIEDHKAALLAELELQGEIPQELQDQLWRNIDYSNFMVCSFMKTTVGSVMISTGYLKKVNIVNNKWAEETRRSLKSRMDSY